MRLSQCKEFSAIDDDWQMSSVPSISNCPCSCRVYCERVPLTKITLTPLLQELFVLSSGSYILFPLSEYACQQMGNLNEPSNQLVSLRMSSSRYNCTSPWYTHATGRGRRLHSLRPSGLNHHGTKMKRPRHLLHRPPRRNSPQNHDGVWGVAPGALA